MTEPAQDQHADPADSRYAAELDARFQELTQWAIANWPVKETPLQISDFMASRKEIDAIRGSRISETRIGARSAPAASDSGSTRQTNGNPDDGQFVDVTPMPWP